MRWKQISRLGGNDIICGNAGDDYLEGGTGADDIRGGAGRDEIYRNEKN